MRVWVVCAAAILCLPGAVAEFGIEEDGYPVSADGFSHHPAQRFDAEALAELQERAWADLGQEPPLNQVGPATLYPYYPILLAEIERLALDHPDKVRVHKGTSTLGLDIHFLEIANWGDEDALDFVPLEEREVVMIDGGTHSNEYSGVYFVLAVAQWLLDGSPEDEFAQWVLENRHTIITPMVNPDGSHAMGRLNINAVNVNRNFPVLWGGDGTDMLLNNPGPSPGSEVETQLIVDRVMHYQPDYHGSIHCCGNLWLFPYGEDGLDPYDLVMLEHICDVAYPAEIREDCGPIWSTIYPASGSTVDTVYNYTGAVAFGFEMSGRSNLAGPWGEPVTFEQVAVQEAESWGGVMHAFENVHLYGGYPVIEAMGVVNDTTTITLRNAGYGPLTVSISGDDMMTMRFVNLTANTTTTMTVPGAVVNPGTSGIGELRIDYQKRIMQSPMGRIVHTVDPTLGEGLQLGLDGQAIPLAEPVEVFEAGSDEAAPTVAPWLLVGLLAVMALRRRG